MRSEKFLAFPKVQEFPTSVTRMFSWKVYKNFGITWNNMNLKSQCTHQPLHFFSHSSLSLVYVLWRLYINLPMIPLFHMLCMHFIKFNEGSEDKTIINLSHCVGGSLAECIQLTMCVELISRYNFPRPSYPLHQQSIATNPLRLYMGNVETT